MSADVFVVMSETWVYAEDADAARERVEDELSPISPEPVTTKAIPKREFPPLDFEKPLTCDWCSWWKQRENDREREA